MAVIGTCHISDIQHQRGEEEMKRGLILVLFTIFTLGVIAQPVLAHEETTTSEQVIKAVKDSMNILGTKISGVVESATPAAKEGWRILVFKNYAEGIYYGAMSFLCLLIFGIPSYPIFKAGVLAPTESVKQVVCLISGTLCVTLALVSLLVFVFSGWGLQVLVPEYYAIQDLFEVVKSVK